MARTAILVCLPLLTLSCGGGTAGPVGSTATESREPAGTGGRDSPGGAREPASGGLEGAPASQDPAPPSQDPSGAATGTGATGGGGGGCVPCDAQYVCNGTLNGTAVKDGAIALKTSNGACIIDGQQSVDAFSCDGKLTVDGKVAGTWKPSGKGFSFSAAGTSIDCQPK
jgi:hypothetical protein